MAYLPLSTANLPDPAINPAQGSSPEDYFNTVTYAGNGTGLGSTQTISNGNFQPDFIWIKSRSTADYHNLNDSVRGIVSTGSPNLLTNTTGAETTFTGYGVSALTSTGFTLIGNGSYTNANGTNYVAWNWKANGSGVSNTDGSITSTVSANTQSGFSIVTYTGVSGGGTVGHGLGAKPSCIIVKNRSQADNWWIWHQGMESSGENGEDYLFFTTAASADDGYQYLANNSTTFTPQGTSKLMQDGGNFVAYCWSEIEGYSKCSSYVGNGNADGPFVYTGFSPAFVMVKDTGGTGNWSMMDSERGSINVIDEQLLADSSGAESTANDLMDFLSNGFKLRIGTSGLNRLGRTIIYMAFAENPFKYSNAR